MARFFVERVESYLREHLGMSVDVIRAVSAATGRLPDNVKDCVARAEAIRDTRGSADFAAICAAFKRMKNILKQAREQGEFEESLAGINNDAVPVELNLIRQATVIAARVELMARKREYHEALREIASLRPQVDAFFDGVMVMDPDKKIRMGRLTLLESILARFTQIADFSEIVTAG
jgi:glycyl-tRNA synthetase beta chain